MTNVTFEDIDIGDGPKPETKEVTPRQLVQYAGVRKISRRSITTPHTLKALDTMTSSSWRIETAILSQWLAEWAGGIACGQAN